MDSLALGVIAVGMVAAIGVVLVAMGGSGAGDSAASVSAEAAKPPAAQARPRPRPRRRPPAAANHAGPPIRHIGYTTGAADPLVAGFMQVVSTELETLRQQQGQIDQRLTLINGIAELMHDMQGTSANGSNGHVVPRSNHRAAAGG